MKEEKDVKKKYLSLVLDKEKDKDLIERLSLVSKIGGVSMREIIVNGLNSENIKLKVNEGMKVFKEMIR